MSPREKRRATTARRPSGEFSWRELATTDADASWAFHAEVFGWEDAGRMDMGEMGFYQVFGRSGHPLGGIFNGPPEMPAVGWLLYVRVPDVHEAVEGVKELGGRVLTVPWKFPATTTSPSAWIPRGSAFAVHHTADAGTEA